MQSLSARLATVVVAAVALGGGCTTVSAAKPSGRGAPVQLSAVRDRGTQTVAGRAGEATIDVDEFSYEPTFLRVQVASTVRVALANDGEEIHSFVFVSTPGTEVIIAPGRTARREIRFPGPGKFVFFCKFHRKLGMQGAFIVRPA